MRKTITLCMLFVAMIAMARTSQSPGNWVTEPFYGKARNICAVQKTDIAPVVILEEDFSLFTAGTEELPDTVNIAPEVNYRYYVDDRYTHTPGWGGYNVYQAGGAAYLKMYTHEWYGIGYGYLKTPRTELYGTATVTFKARRANTNPDAGKIDLSICDDSYGRLESTVIDVTNSWAEYSWTTSSGAFNENGVFQISPIEGEILIDDVKVTRVRNRIPGTETVEPINNSVSEFVARWMPSELSGIDGYLFSVYYKGMPEDAPAPGSVALDFESINLDSDGNIDSGNPGYPDGWYINVSSNGSKDMCTASGDYNSGKQAINFDSAGDTILSPVTPAPINKISFWIKPSNMVQESGYYSLVGVAVKHADGEWEHIANIPNYWMEAGGGYYTLEGDVVGEYIYQVRLTCETSYDVTFAIDDVTLDYAPQPVPCPLITDELVTDTFRVVSGIDPSKEHFYYVKVKEGELVSDASYDMWVDGILGVTPKALPATDLSETGFTANWEPIYNAGYYKLSIAQKYVTQTAGEEVELVSEDFSLLTEGSVNSPYNPWTMTHSLCDNNQSEQDWMLVNPRWANGMAGSGGTSWSGAAGLVVSPMLKFGNNDIKVEVTAYNTVPGDTLWVMIMDDYTANMALLGKTIGMGTDNAGYTSGSVTFSGNDFGDKPLYVAFMSQVGSTFFIDEAKISLVVPEAGTAIERPFRIVNHEENSFTLEGLPENVRSYSYNVVAKRTKNFVDYVSEVSETISVELPVASVENVSSDNGSHVYSVNGALCVISQELATVEVYNMCGMLVKAAEVGVGETSIPMRQGIYIVKIGDTAHKIAVN